MNWLELNDDKTEFIIFGTPSQLRKVTTGSIRVGEHPFKQKPVYSTLEPFFDRNMKMDVHVNKTTDSLVPPLQHQ